MVARSGGRQKRNGTGSTNVRFTEDAALDIIRRTGRGMTQKQCSGLCESNVECADEDGSLYVTQSRRVTPEGGDNVDCATWMKVEDGKGAQPCHVHVVTST